MSTVLSADHRHSDNAASTATSHPRVEPLPSDLLGRLSSDAARLPARPPTP